MGTLSHVHPPLILLIVCSRRPSAAESAGRRKCQRQQLASEHECRLSQGAEHARRQLSTANRCQSPLTTCRRLLQATGRCRPPKLYKRHAVVGRCVAAEQCPVM